MNYLLPKDLFYRLDHLLTGRGHGTEETGNSQVNEMEAMADRTKDRSMGNKDQETPDGSMSITLDEYQITNKFTVMSLNARSINNKFQNIRDAVHRVDPAVLCIQETWGKNELTDYSIKNYHKPIFKTRHEFNMNAGGGVAIWVKESLQYGELKSPFKSKEIETIAIHLPQLKMDVINVYRGFVNTEHSLNEIFEWIDERKGKGALSTVIVGDFNIDLKKHSQDREYLMTCMAERKFVQCVQGTTRYGTNPSTIDHIYVSSKNKPVSFNISADISDHNILTVTVGKEKIGKVRSKVTKRWITQDQYDNIRLFLREEDWTDLEHMNCNQAAEYLVAKINEIMDIFSPVETKELSSRPINQWKTKGLAISLARASKMYAQSKKQSASDKMRSDYKKYKKVLDATIRQAKELHYNKRIAAAGTDGRQIWSIINEVVDRKQCRHKMPDTFRHNGNVIKGEQDIANGFNEYFASIGTDMANSLPTEEGYETYLNLSPDHYFSLARTTEVEVEKIMRNQKPKLSCGIDTINNKIVKICSKELAKPMTIIINKSLDEGIVPAAFKIARIIPLYKKKAADEFGNYRPVSLLSALSKILEKVVCAQMMHFFEVSKSICDTQYGFRNKSQTTHVVQNMLNFIAENAANNQPIIATFIDLSKAFDCLQYDKLFRKMKSLGFQPHTIKWFIDYLSNRKQITDVNGTVSEMKDMLLGVPQGSILGPILFLIYVNDINNSDSRCTFTKFADDTTMLTTGESL